MSFKEFIKEVDVQKAETEMNIINLVSKIQNDFVSSFKSLEELKQIVSDKEKNVLLNNVSLDNSINQIETRMIDVGTKLTNLQQTIVGQRTFTGISGGTEEPN